MRANVVFNFSPKNELFTFKNHFQNPQDSLGLGCGSKQYTTAVDEGVAEVGKDFLDSDKKTVKKEHFSKSTGFTGLFLGIYLEKHTGSCSLSQEGETQQKMAEERWEQATKRLKEMSSPVGKAILREQRYAVVSGRYDKSKDDIHQHTRTLQRTMRSFMASQARKEIGVELRAIIKQLGLRKEVYPEIAMWLVATTPTIYLQRARRVWWRVFGLLRTDDDEDKETIEMHERMYQLDVRIQSYQRLSM